MTVRLGGGGHGPRRRGRRLIGVLTTGALLAAGALYAVAQAGPAFAATTANVWLTTPDKTNLLTQKAAVTFGTAGSGQVITVNPATAYQSMVGFGASLTDASATNIWNSPARDAIMNSLFSPTGGIGLNWLRQPIGASDFSNSFFSYDDGAADPALSRFSVAHDQSSILPLLNQARALNPQLTVLGTPWSAPGWMKTGGNMVGGSLAGGNENVFATYLTKFVQAYQAAGIPVSYLTVANEPQYSPGGYPGMLMSASQENTVINALAPKLAAAGLNTKILGWDHNWDNTSYPQQVLAGTGNNTAGTAWHCYGGSPTGQTTVHNAYPGKDTFFTECSAMESANPANTFADTLLAHGRDLAVGAPRNWARTVTTWNLALNTGHGPVIGNGCNCTGVVTVNGSGYTPAADYYVLGHLAKFVKPGAVRVDSTNVAQGGVQNVAFRNPDGGIVLVAVNTGATQNFQVSYNGSSFGYNLPAGAMATFTWPGSGTTTPPSSPPPGGGGGTGQITGIGGKCADVAGASTANGAAAQLYTCNGTAAQQWTVGTDGTVRALGKCLDVTAAGTANGTKVQLYDCNGSNAQKWTPSGKELVNTGSNRCLDATGNSSADGTRLQIWDCANTANQQWNLPG